MALSQLQRAQVTGALDEFCNRVPPTARNQLRYSYRIKGGQGELLEHRPAFNARGKWTDLGVAKFRYIESRKVWRLYCQHRDLKWHEYQRRPEARNFDQLMAEVLQDPTRIFLG